MWCQHVCHLQPIVVRKTGADGSTTTGGCLLGIASSAAIYVRGFVVGSTPLWLWWEKSRAVRNASYMLCWCCFVLYPASSAVFSACMLQNNVFVTQSNHTTLSMTCSSQRSALQPCTPSTPPKCLRPTQLAQAANNFDKPSPVHANTPVLNTTTSTNQQANTCTTCVSGLTQ